LNAIRRNIAITRQRGSVLVLVLVIVSSMTALAFGLAYRTRTEMKLVKANAQQVCAYHLAMGGIERAIAQLSTKTDGEVNVTCLGSFTNTVTSESLFNGLSDQIVEDSCLWYAIRDEQGFLNINKSDPAIWANIEVLNKGQRACILDWQDTDNDTNPEGAESDFYETLEPPCIAKNGPILSLRELLYVRNISYDVYLGRKLYRNVFLDRIPNEDPSVLFDVDKHGSDLGLIDIFTVYGTGQININTAPRVILAALPGLDEATAEAILSHRSGEDGRPGTDDDVSLKSAADLANVPGVTELQIELLGQYCCFSSEYFRTYSYARTNTGNVCCLMATIRHNDNGTQVIHVETLF